MANGQADARMADKWPKARRRWGTHSVRVRTGLRQLIADALLYDMLVFPVPKTRTTTDRKPRAGFLNCSRSASPRTLEMS